MHELVQKIQVNIPFTLLTDAYFARFEEYGLNPEIGFDASSLDRFSLSDIRERAKALYALGRTITVHAPFMDLSPGSPDPAIRDLTRHRFEQTLRAVSILKPVTVVCHTGYDRKRYGHMLDSWLEKSLPFWSWFGQGVRDEGSRLMLENVYEKGPREILMLLEALAPSKAGLCLDVGHQAAFSQVPLKIWLDELGTHLGQLHLHDNDGKVDAHLPPGRGNVDFQLLFSVLGESMNESPLITIEPHRVEDLWPCFEFLEKIWPW